MNSTDACDPLVEEGQSMDEQTRDLCLGIGAAADALRDNPCYAQTLGLEMDDALDRAAQSGRSISDVIHQLWPEQMAGLHPYEETILDSFSPVERLVLPDSPR